MDYADYGDSGIRVYKCMRMYLWSASTVEGFGPLPKRFFSPDDSKALTCNGRLRIDRMKRDFGIGSLTIRRRRGEGIVTFGRELA